MIKTAIIALLGLVMHAEAVHIRSTMKARVANPMMETVDGILQMLDTSGDGVISEEEYK